MKPLCAALFLLASACVTGSHERTPAQARTTAPNFVIVAANRADVWKKAIPRLGARFFVINNLDAASGLINVSYSGDPEKYVDGGVITTRVQAPPQSRTFSFPAAKAYQEYMAVDNGRLYVLTRKMELEGRANIIVEELTAGTTKVTANVRYVLTRTISRSIPGRGQLAPSTSTASFNSGQAGSFSASGNDTYYATGALESDILQAFTQTTE